MKKYISILYICLFVLLLILPTVVFSVAGHKIDQENFENRNMAEKPKFLIENILEFPKEYENFYNDNLPFRSQLIRANALLNYNFFKQSPINKVIIGQDGWLFYNPPKEDSDPIGQCTGLRLSDAELKEIADNLLSIRESLEKENKEFIVLIAPNKESIYGEKYLPETYNAKISNTVADQVVEYLQKSTDLKIIYPKPNILNAIESYPQYDFYYKLDTHWNFLGGYLGAKDLLSCLNIVMPEFNQLDITYSCGRIGDLSGMTGIQDLFTYDNEYTANGYPAHQVIEDTSVKNIERYTTLNGDKRKLLIIKDSFATSLYPYINSQFVQTDYVHITSYYTDALTESNPDVVILEVVERYISRLATFKIK